MTKKDTSKNVKFDDMSLGITKANTMVGARNSEKTQDKALYTKGAHSPDIISERHSQRTNNMVED